MKVRVLYDGECPFCDDYVRFQKIRAAAGDVELIDARANPRIMQEMGVTGAELEDGMVVWVDGRRHDGADAVHVLSRIGEPPGRWWVRWVAAASRSSARSRALYPVLKLGRRVALRILGVPRFPR